MPAVCLSLLVYIGPAEGKPKEEWKLQTPAALLNLKICDIALGSGAFLVQVCRYLSERLVEAWEEVEAQGGIRITPEGEPARGVPEERLLPADPDERLAIARRVIVDRCLYGVDKNPMAVEMAKLSLWLITLSKNKPFTFLDHALKSGDSLLGLSDIEQITTWSLNKTGSTLLKHYIADHVSDAVETRRCLEYMPDNDIREVHEKEKLHAKAEEQIARLKLAGDLIVGATLEHKKPTALKNELLRSQMIFSSAVKFEEHVTEADDKLRYEAESMLHGNRPFHWALEFPEVFIDTKPVPVDRQSRLELDLPGQQELELSSGTVVEAGSGGFDAIISNPPFMRGKSITGSFGDNYREYLVHNLAGGTRGNADLCAYFFLRARGLLRDNGIYGMLATNSIAQGDTHIVGLKQLARSTTTIRALSSLKWPGAANLTIAALWLACSCWNGEQMIDGSAVRGIGSSLAEESEIRLEAKRLVANAGISFIGPIVLGMGFVLDPVTARHLIDQDSQNAGILFPYINVKI